MCQPVAVFLLFVHLVFFVPETIASPCPNQFIISVLFADEQAAAVICEASAHALTILAQYGLSPKRQICVEVIDQEIDHLGYKAFGSYDSKRDRIRVMSYQSIFYHYTNPTMYDEQFDVIHYSGVIVHEITHAVFHHHSTADAPGPAPQEYLAHAIQLLSLPEDRRNRVITTHNEPGWMPGDAISDIYLALEPGRFAVKSYKHLTSMDDPRNFIDLLLTAKWFYIYVP
ncbi:DUF6639 family protein [Desulforhopalus singaporensis]|uniref:Uncharacterized protein n=1 Tax=Desulforhopalus singaporensis TaxID=91360 RepID=A0A1H0L8C3_9BACT|nr:DUF6639 family protein [Desulforhopalus singaporensis]SDO64467.1 hypothetical protein SAMN05660330_00701 [Desulforhopalus singaporensis]